MKTKTNFRHFGKYERKKVLSSGIHAIEHVVNNQLTHDMKTHTRTQSKAKRIYTSRQLANRIRKQQQQKCATSLL